MVLTSIYPLPRMSEGWGGLLIRNAFLGFVLRSTKKYVVRLLSRLMNVSLGEAGFR